MKLLAVFLLAIFVPISKTSEFEEIPFHDLQIEVSPCYPSDFANGGNCTLCCYVETENVTSEYNWIDYAWRYSSEYYDDSLRHVFPSIELFDNVTSGDWRTYLALDSYNAGYYICEFAFAFNETYIFFQQIAIKIDNQTQGAFLNESCENSTDCLAIHSSCNISGVCECDLPYYINYNGMDTTPACLKHLSEGKYCNLEEECTVVNEDYHCDVVCYCEGYKMPIAEENNATMCVAPEFLNDTCMYNEQCQMRETNSYCNTQDGGYCDCPPGYIMNITGSDKFQYNCGLNDPTTTISTSTITPTTGPPSNGMSPGAIAGTVIGCVAGVAIIGGLVFIMVKKMK